MAIPLRQRMKLGAYLARQKISRREHFPLIVELEPLFACNLECAGCGKIQYPTDILRKRLSPQEVFDSVEECGAPIVSIAGGEPLIHPEIKEIVDGLIARGKFIYLCTNAILLEKNLDKFKPSPNLIFSI